MAHGAPDASNVVKQRRVYSLSDDAELAVRMGGPHSIDRLGDVLWQETFAHALGGWEPYVSDPACWIVRSPVTYLTDGFAMHMHAEGAGVEQAWMEHSWMWEYTGLLGAEWWLAGGYYSQYVYLQWYSGNADGIAQYNLRLDNSNEELQYQNAAGAWVTIRTDLDGFRNTHRFVPIKVVIDPVAEEWVEVAYNGQWIDMGGFAAYWPMAILPWGQQQQVYVTNLAGYGTNLHVDNVIFTQNEPVRG